MFEKILRRGGGGPRGQCAAALVIGSGPRGGEASVGGGGRRAARAPGAHVALLAQAVHVRAEAELLLEGLHVGREARQPDESCVVHLERLLHLARDGLVADAVAAVARDRDAVLARHRDHRRAVVLHDRAHGERGRARAAGCAAFLPIETSRGARTGAAERGTFACIRLHASASSISAGRAIDPQLYAAITRGDHGSVPIT